jgi:hypothetical protein
MLTDPIAFAAEKNKLLGAAPVWILVFIAGGVTYYVSDNIFVIGPWGVTTLNWAKSWGTLSEGISGTLNEFRVSDFNMDFLIDPDASPNMEDLAEAYPLEAAAASLFLWFHGCPDPPQQRFRGYLKDICIPDETTVRATIQDETLRLEKRMVGTVVSLSDYPHADLDDVGKVMPIVIGSVANLPALAVDAGVQTSLPAYLDQTATSFLLSTTTGLAVNKVIQIDGEQIKILGLLGDSVSSCTRGFNATVATTHQKGAVAWEQKAEFIYLAADTPVDSIPKVKSRIGQALMDITSICTRYPAGDHPSYPGKAVVSVPGFVTATQAISLLATGGLTPGQATDVVNFIGVTNDISASTMLAIIDAGHVHTAPLTPLKITPAVISQFGFTPDTTGSWAALFDGNVNTAQDSTVGAAAQMNIGMAPIAANQPGKPTRYKFIYTWARISGTTFTVNMGSDVWQSIIPANQDWTWVKANARLIVDIPAQSGKSWWFTDVSMIVEVDPSTTNVGATIMGNGNVAATVTGDLPVTGTAALASAIAGNPVLSGNSVANTLIGEAVLCDVVRAFASQQAALNSFVSGYCGLGAATVSGILPAGYVLNGAITEYKSAQFWLNEFAFQLRSWFRVSNGSARFIVRPDARVSMKTLESCRIDGGRKIHSRKKTSYDEILNEVVIRYKRDWSQTKGNSAYQAVSSGAGPDAGSVANYGHCERPELFLFDFVTVPAMADSLQSFYLGFYKERHWLHEFQTFLQHSELEFADVVTLDFGGSAVGEILEVKPSPGDSTRSDIVGMVVIV